MLLSFVCEFGKKGKRVWRKKKKKKKEGVSKINR